MRAVVMDGAGDPSVLRVGEVASLELGPGDLRIRIAAFAVNRADIMQRRGHYPPPPGAPETLGLECAGQVVEVGEAVSGWSVGDRAMALLAGGGYAEETVVPAACALPVPEGLSDTDAAAIPEVFLTVFLNVFQIAGFPDGGSALVHGGGSGIGTAAIQLVKAAGGHILVTAGSEAKCQRCLALGADQAIDYRAGSFLGAVKEATAGEGVHVVLDHIGAPYLADNLAALRTGGSLVLIGLMGGAKAELNLGLLLARRLRVIGSTLRALPVSAKAELVRGFQDRFGADLAEGRIRAVVDRVLPMEDVVEAHRAMEASEHFGKIVLTP